jgi:mannose-6-phosphate isomerase-like protein (cupin superfamily)
MLQSGWFSMEPTAVSLAALQARRSNKGCGMTEISFGRVEPDAKARAMVTTERGRLYMVGRPLVGAQGSVTVEDFGAGEQVRWAFWHAEAHYILGGEARVTYTMPPWHDTEREQLIGEGSFYIIPAGAELTFHVSPEAPLRKLCVIMPLEPGYSEVRPEHVTRLES